MQIDSKLNQSLSQGKKDWALSIYKPKINATKKMAWCEVCGHTYSHDLKTKKYTTCPHCNRRLKVNTSRKSRNNVKYYVASMEVVDNWQVIRYYYVEIYMRKGEGMKNFIKEVQRVYLQEDLQEYCVRRSTAMSYYRDKWVFDTPLTLKGSKIECYCDIYPKSKVLPLFVRNGFSPKVFSEPFNLLRKIVYSPWFETIMKAKMFSVAELCLNRYTNDLFPALKICIRNNYKIKDAEMWSDYISLLIREGKDIKNTYYVCPKDLKKAHDDAVNREKLRQEKIAKIRRLKRMAEDKVDRKNYADKIEKFLCLKISNADIDIQAIPTIEAVKEEGEKMHHCVFENKYYNKRYSILLSARDKQGNRIETIEFDTQKRIVIQSRGVNNCFTPYHKDIINMVQSNVNLLKLCNYGDTTKK